MKFAFTLLLVVGLTGSLHAQLFQQDFSAGAPVANYVNTSPSDGQWNSISTSGSGTTVGITNNALHFRRNGANAGAFARTMDFSGPPTALLCRFSLAVSNSAGAATTAGTWLFGSAFTVNASSDGNATVHSRLALNFTAVNGQFSLRNLVAGTNSATFDGGQVISWFINNSGTSINYPSPAGPTESLADDTADVWVGNVKAIDDAQATTASQSLADWKFFVSSGTATVIMDDFLVTTNLSGPVTVTRPYVTFGPVLTNGIFAVRYKGVPDTTYTIETNVDFSPNGWGKTLNTTSDPSGDFEFVSPAGTAPGSTYFRTVSPSY